jgi:TonB family protein
VKQRDWDRVTASLDRGRIASAWALSVAVHFALAATGAVLVAHSLSADEAAALARAHLEAPELVEVELPAVSAGLLADGAAPSTEVPPPERGGGESTPRPDTGDDGRGGDDLARAAAQNLADRDDGLTLTRSVLSHLDRSQLSRIEAGDRRQSREDRRSSREPMELTFLASGETGTRRERRAMADSDPRRGIEGAGRPSELGSAPGAAAAPPGIGRTRADAGSSQVGADRSSPGSGVRDGAPSPDARDSMKLALARPLVARDTPSVAANDTGRPKDTQDSEQEVALAMQSIVHASTAGGPRGDGRGGVKGSGPTGSGGSAGPGSRAKALGDGKGAARDALAQRRTDYLLSVMRKIRPLWQNAFPKWAALEGLQGTAIVSFVIRSDGSVESAVISRPSGVPEFDENVRQAVLRGAPYGRLPPELGSVLRWQMPFTAENPAVRPFDPSSAR